MLINLSYYTKVFEEMTTYITVLPKMYISINTSQTEVKVNYYTLLNKYLNILTFFQKIVYETNKKTKGFGYRRESFSRLVCRLVD